MKTTLAASLFALSLQLSRVLGQIDVSGLPTCARSCLQSAIATQTACSTDDSVCLCNSYSLGTELGTCFVTDCTSNQALDAVTKVSDWCNQLIFGSESIAIPSFTIPDFSIPTALQSLIPSELASFIANPTAADLNSIVSDILQTALPTGNSFNANGNGRPGKNTDEGGLSTGAKIGLGVAVPLVVLAIAGIVLFFCLRRRRNKKNNPILPSQQTAQAPPAAYQANNAAMAVAPGTEKPFYPPPGQEGYAAPPQQPYGVQQQQAYMAPPQKTDYNPNTLPPPPAYGQPPQQQMMAAPPGSQYSELQGSASPVSAITQPYGGTQSNTVSMYSVAASPPPPQQHQGWAPPGAPNGQIYEAPAVSALPPAQNGAVEMPASNR